MEANRSDILWSDCSSSESRSVGGLGSDELLSSYSPRLVCWIWREMRHSVWRASEKRQIRKTRESKLVFQICRFIRISDSGKMNWPWKTYLIWIFSFTFAAIDQKRIEEASECGWELVERVWWAGRFGGEIKHFKWMNSGQIITRRNSLVGPGSSVDRRSTLRFEEERSKNGQDKLVVFMRLQITREQHRWYMFTGCSPNVIQCVGIQLSGELLALMMSKSMRLGDYKGDELIKMCQYLIGFTSADQKKNGLERKKIK